MGMVFPSFLSRGISFTERKMMMTYSNSKTKQRILDVAVTYFTLYGYEGTNLEDIGKALGLSRGPLYYYFKNKNDLYLAAIRYQMEISSQDLQRIYAEDLDVLAKSAGIWPTAPPIGRLTGILIITPAKDRRWKKSRNTAGTCSPCAKRL
ncbi:TetR/AcrR family transcriptional regulator [Holdemania massiliensis]|uniref:TetR/AcrR family transcriptional regulator n=1 Tax=Holdemania massiliensis TaxID=1468449 RepID=UPI003520C8DC